MRAGTWIRDGGDVNVWRVVCSDYCVFCRIRPVLQKTGDLDDVKALGSLFLKDQSLSYLNETYQF